MIERARRHYYAGHKLRFKCWCFVIGALATFKLLKEGDVDA